MGIGWTFLADNRLTSGRTTGGVGRSRGSSDRSDADPGGARRRAARRCGAPGGLRPSCRRRARAFLIARAPEAPWQMMQAPRMPSSGPPPNSSYSNRVLSRFKLAATLWPGVAGEVGHEPGQLFLERREQELDGPFAGLEQDVADEPVADDDPDVSFVDVAALDVADEPGGPGAVLIEGAGRAGQLVPLLVLGADVQQADAGARSRPGSSRRRSPP